MSLYNEACESCRKRREREKLLIGAGFWGKKCAVLTMKDKELRKIILKMGLALQQIILDEEQMGVKIHSPDALDVLEDIKARMESL